MTILKRIIALSALCVCVVTGALAATNFEVKAVEAQQRYPWNGKVDIDFLIESSDADAECGVSVVCMDHVGNTNFTLRTIRYNDKGEAAMSFTLKPGRHRLTWDADADVPNVKLARVSFAVVANLMGEIDAAEYLIIDLSDGAEATSYPVTTRMDVPEGGWTDEYKLTKLVLRRCPAGADPLGRYTLTKDFYAGVFEVTENQWKLVTGSKPGNWDQVNRGDMCPVEQVSYTDIRGESADVDATSFLGKLRAKTGLSELDLPTYAQWEYACRAGTTTTYITGDPEDVLAEVGWHSGNSGRKKHTVGEKAANALGLYDMHGNVGELCLDFSWGDHLSGTDPIGARPASVYGCNCRGGSAFEDPAFAASSYYGTRCDSTYRSKYAGFRLFRTVP